MHYFFSNNILFSEEVLNSLHILPGTMMDCLMIAASLIGMLPFFITSALFISWHSGYRKGIYIIIAVLLSHVINNFAKTAFHHPRPDPALLIYADLAIQNMPLSFSFPSGHAQGAMVFFGLLMILFRSFQVRVLCMVMIVLISYSRMYLGVHFPGDIAGGLFLGALILAPFAFFLRQNGQIQYFRKT